MHYAPHQEQSRAERGAAAYTRTWARGPHRTGGPVAGMLRAHGAQVAAADFSFVVNAQFIIRYVRTST